MSAGTISFLNFGIHSLVLAALGWVIVRFFIRDALRRSIAANLAILFCIIGAFDISFWPYPYHVEEVPVLTAIHQTFEADWRINVTPITAPPSKEAPSSSIWNVDAVVQALRWIVWSITALMLLRPLVQSVRVQRWAWRLRSPTQAEYDALPADSPFECFRVFDGEGAPCVAGWFFPVIAVPATAFEQLTRNQWRWIIRHEQEHLRCNDTVAVLLQNIVLAFVWWNPFAHALIEHYARAREEACDAAALDEERDDAGYADFLLAWAAKPAASPGCVMSIAQSRPARRLRARLVAIMAARRVRKRLGSLFILGCLAGVVAGPMFTSSIGFATSAVAQESKSTPSGAMLTRIYRVPPDFVAEGGTAKQMLEQAGVSFPDGANAVMNRVTSQLVAHHTAAGHEMIQRVVSERSVVSPQVYATSRIIVGGQFYGTANGVLSAVQLQDMFETIRSNKSSRLSSAPSVTMKVGTQATIEMVREAPPEVKNKFIGCKLELGTLKRDKGRLEVLIKPAFATDNGDALLIDPKAEPPDWSRVLILGTQASNVLSSGETLVAHLPVGEMRVTVLVTMTALRPDGKTATGFDQNLSLLSPDENKRARDTNLSREELERMAKEEVTTGAKLAAAAARKKIYLTAKVVDVTQPKGGGPFMDWVVKNVLTVPGKPEVEEKETAINSGFAPAAPGIFSLSGVLTDPQFQVVIRALSQIKGAKLSSLPSLTMPNAAPARFTLPKDQGDADFSLRAIMGADGYTLDMTVAIPSPDKDPAKQLNTSATIWDGQTLMLGGPISEDEKGSHSRLIFITAAIIDPSGAPVKK